MDFLDSKSVNEWLKKLEIVNAENKIIFKQYQYYGKYRIPADSGRKTALARLISDLMINNDELLLLITEYGIWPSAENFDLFYGYRTSIGETDSLPNKPGHLIAENESSKLNALLAMIFYFCWGALLIREDSKYLLSISHDEYIKIYYKLEKDKLEIFDSFGLKMIE